MNAPGFVTRSLRLKALAVSLALATWVAVVYSGNPPESRTVSVHIPQDAATFPAPFVLVRPIPDVVLRVNGTREHLSGFDPSTLRVTPTFSVIKTTGVVTVPLVVVNRNADVELDAPPASISVEVDKITSRSKAVVVTFLPPPPRGYIVGPGTADPSQVVVTGPSREVETVIPTVTIDMSQQKTNVSEQRAVLLEVEGHRVTDVGINSPTVQVSATVTQSATSRASAVVPRTSGTVASGHQLGGISVDPATVVLTGSQDVLNALDSIPTTAIDLTGLSTDRVVTVKIVLPAGVTSTPDTVTVRISVKPLPTPSPPAQATSGAAPTP